MATGRAVLRVVAVVCSVSLAAGLVAYQSGCQVLHPEKGGGDKQMLYGTKSGPVFPPEKPGSKPQRLLLSGSKSADITRGGTTVGVETPQKATQQQAVRQGAQQPNAPR